MSRFLINLYGVSGCENILIESFVTESSIIPDKKSIIDESTHYYNSGNNKG